MAAILTLRNIFWITTTGVEVLLLVYLLRRRKQIPYPLLVIYIASTIAQSALAAFVYGHWGFNSNLASTVIWSSQGVVISLRFSAVYEMALRTLSNYAGIWALAKRLLIGVAAVAMGYAALVAPKKWSSLILNVDRGLELGIATFVVALLLFVRYYLVPMQALDRALAMGFGMYSCFYVINDSLLEKFLNNYVSLWGYLDILTFLASLLIWLLAVAADSRAPESAVAGKNLLVGVYGSLSPELNFRLQHLNEQISELLHARTTQE